MIPLSSASRAVCAPFGQGPDHEHPMQVNEFLFWLDDYARSRLMAPSIIAPFYWLAISFVVFGTAAGKPVEIPSNLRKPEERIDH